MNKIKNAFNVLLEKLWPLYGSLSEEIIVFAVAFLLSPFTGHGVFVTWIYIWCVIAIVRIAVYGKTIDKNCE